MKNKPHPYRISIILACWLMASAWLYAQTDALTVNITLPTKQGHCIDGKIDLHINGGYPPYDVEWTRTFNAPPVYNITVPVQQAYQIQGNNDGEDVANAMDGIYTVTVTDDLCGVATESYSINCICSKDCKVVGEVKPAKCGQGGYIEADLVCNNQIDPYVSYKWDDLKPYAPQGPERLNLTPGTYCVTITDKAECSYKSCFVVKNEDKDLQIKVKEIENVPICKGNCTGSITIEVPYGAEITWQNIPNTDEIHKEKITDLCPNKTYTVQVVWGECKVTKSFPIKCCASAESEQENIEPLSVTAIPHSSGQSITLDIEGGAGTLYYEWTGPNGFTSTQGSIYNLAIGTYCVKVFDGCSEATACTQIVKCDEIKITATVENTCQYLSVGNISLEVSGGTPPYEAIWTGDLTGLFIDNLSPGTYCVSIKDKYGCRADYTCFEVGINPSEITVSTTPCQRIIKCNGEEYTDYANYTSSLKCNILTLYCPLSGGSLTFDLGWYDVYADEYCNAYGVCQDGNEVYLGSGQIVSGTFYQPYSGCNGGYVCYDQACNIGGNNYYYAGSQAYCSTVTYDLDLSCSTTCVENVWCLPSLLISSECIYCGIQSEKNEKSSNNLNLPTLQYKKDLFAHFNTQPYNLEETQNKITISPNPFHSNIEIIFVSETNTSTIIEILNSTGEKVLQQQTQTIEIGKNTITLNTINLAAGLYLVNIYQNNLLINTQKIVKN
ncbi:MAG: T9SS type A sorting domain-containing protein [Chitinophagales bacterium]|nr:T9SS type A sorting domain-containing protein [Bacteroidota bacterium]MCB9043087.1 T9SS type A sorting domain-containing protein [Chitinophagales bacterium]